MGTVVYSVIGTIAIVLATFSLYSCISLSRLSIFVFIIVSLHLSIIRRRTYTGMRYSVQRSIVCTSRPIDASHRVQIRL